MKTGTKFNVEESDVPFDFMQSFLDTIPGNAIVLDQNGTIVCSDSEWIGSAEEFGFSKKNEYKGSDYFEIMSSIKCISDGVQKDLLQEVKKLLYGELKQFECIYDTKVKDGNYQTSLIGKEFNYAGNKWVSITYLDVTKQKKDHIIPLDEDDEFNVIFDQVAVGMAMVSLNGRFLQVNKKFCEIFGYSCVEMIRLSYKDITYSEDFNLYTKDIEQLKIGQKDSFTGEKRYIHKNGQVIWGKITISLIRKKSGESKCLHAVFEDVSDRQKIETALNESEINYKNLVEQAQDGIALLHNDKVKFVNSAMIDLAGYPKEELIGKPFVSFISDDELLRVLEIHRKRLNGEKVQEIYETVIKKKSGDTLEVEFNSRLSDNEGVQIVMIRDISERKKTEKEQKLIFDELQQERNMFISGPVVVFKWSNSAGYPTEYVSPNVYEVFGYTPEELTSGKILYGKLISELDIERVNKEDFTQKEIKKNNHYTQEPYRIIRKNGEIIWVLDHTTIIRDEKGTIVNYLGYVVDITQQKKTEELLRESEEKFRTHVTNIEEIVYILDSKGKFLLSEGKGLSNLGLDPGEVVGKSIYELYSNFPDIISNVDKALKGETVRFEISVNGRIFRNWYTPHKGKGGEVIGLFGLSVDVTEQLKSKEIIKASEERLAGFIESATDGFALFDSDLNLVLNNDMILKIFPLPVTKNVKIGANILEIVPFLKKTDRYKKYVEVLKTGKPLLLKDIVPNEKYGDQSLNIRAFKVNDGLGMIFTDTTDSKRARLALKESEEKYRELIEQSNDGVGLIQDNKIVFTNSVLTEMLGYTKDEFKRINFADIAHPDELPRLIDFHKRRMSGEMLPSIYETRLLKKNGDVLEVEFNVAKTSFLKEAAVLIMARDISERKKIEKEIVKYQERLKALASELIITEEKQRKQIATDLHDHVGQLLASSRLQMAAINNDMEKEVILMKIKSISLGMLQAIQSIRNAIFNLSPPQLNEIGLFAATADWLEDQIELKHGIKTIITGEDRFFSLTENTRFLIFRSIRELLINIVKHAKAENIIVTIKEINKRMHINIEDDGIGFDYNPASFRNKRKSLGLFSIHERVTDIGGSMEIDSKLGRGTLIKLIIPIIE